MKLTKFQKQFFEDNPNISWPLCECGCGEKVLLNYSEPKTVFRRFASSACSRKSKTINKKALALLSDKDWLWEQRFTLRKSKELIATELNISTTPVAKWCKIHDIDSIRLNESDDKIKSILNDSQKLESDYAEGSTIKELAIRYGTSPATLSRVFKKHNLSTREPNSYDRVSRQSQEEKDLVNWIKSVYDGEVVENTRKLITPKEIDIYLPKLKLAIEYNGLFSHIYRPNEEKESLIKGPTYHLSKTTKCLERGVQLFHIFSDQWKKRPLAVKTVLLSKMGLNEKIPARKCKVVEITPYDKNTFLNNYHLQGADRSKIHLGLMYNDELVACMTFGSPRFNKKARWELVRFACRYKTTVVGGFSKLLKHFQSKHEGSVISYADRTYSNGNVYLQNGFDLISVNRPSYHYVNLNNETRSNRTTYTKKALLRMLEIKETNRSESDITKDLKLHKIYDCGTLTFLLE